MRILPRMELQRKHRFFISVFFFLSGFCFSTWASRIPTIKTLFDFNDAELGTMLLLMPLSSLAGLPISGWLVSRYNSRGPLIVSLALLAGSLTLIGMATSVVVLGVGMSLFSFHLRILGIAINSQGLTLQKQTERKIFGSFHGLWSTGGIAGVGFSTFVIAAGIKMPLHLVIVSVITLLTGLYSYRFLLRNDRSTTGNKLILGKPDPLLLILGMLVFLASICEGGMFDWSGVYFKEVVKVDLFTWGYLIFMICMALSRFATDWFVEEVGMPMTFGFSALFIFAGIGLAVMFPAFWPCMAGFCLVGLGTAPVIPITFMLASTVEKYAPPMTISIIATYGIAGVFLGPPLIGYLAHAFDLRIAFITFAISGLMLIPVSRMFFRRQRKRSSR
jgi:MFS family permease